jgi:HEAT repeat protein
MNGEDGPSNDEDEILEFDEYDDFRVFSPEDEDNDDQEPPVAEDKPAIGEVIGHLQAGNLRYADLSGFSDLSTSDLETLSAGWDVIAPELRASVVREASDIASDNVFLEFSRFFLLVSQDVDPVVRQLAVQALGNPLGEDVEPRLIEVLEHDPVEDVRVAAATSLGPWAELAEMGESEPDLRDAIAGALFGIAERESESWHLRRRAAESLAIFGPDLRINRLIQQMYDEDELGLRASAIYSAGRANQRQWLPVVLEELANEDAEIRFEAARAAGVFADVDALPPLSELAKDDDDTDVRHAAIMAIGEIGGRGAIRILNRLAEMAPEGDEEVIDLALIEAALDDSPFA